MSDTKTAAPTFSARGHSGELRHGYQVAGTFGEWTVTSEWTRESLQKPDEVPPHSFVVSVAKLEPDGYWFDMQPQSLRLQIGSRMWVWREAERLSDTRYRVHGDPEIT